MGQAKLDDGIFDLIQSLLNRQQAVDRRRRPRATTGGGNAPRDRRGMGRKGYHCWQLVAWYDGKRLPQQMDFQLVQCRDLSPQGFSFYQSTLPRCRRLVIALGPAPFQFFEADLVRREPARAEREAGWIMGCRFARQLKTRGSPPE